MTYITQSLDFPNKRQFDKLIISADCPPFPEPPASRSLENNPADFMVGREKPFEKLEQLYNQVILSGDPKLGFIQGSQGVGKSTLSSYFVREKIGAGDQLYLIPFETSGSPGGLQFVKFYEMMMNSLFKNKNIHGLGYKLVTKLLLLYETEFREEFDGILLRLKLDRQTFNRICNNPEELKSMVDSTFLSNFIDLFQTKFNFLYDKLPSMAPELYLTIWHAIISNPRSFEALRALKGNGEFEGLKIENDIDARETFKEFIKLIKWVDPRGIVMIVIDHLEAGVSNGEIVYVELFSLLLQLRNLSHLLVILSGTFDAFNTIQEVVQADMSRQIDNWGMNNVIYLDPLDKNEVNQVVSTYLAKFWSEKGRSPPAQNALYPYSVEVISYIYHYFERDLRKTLENLYDHFGNMGLKQQVTPVLTLFEAFRVFRKTNRYLINMDEVRILKEKVLDEKVQDKIRSSRLENGIFHMLGLYATKSNLIHNVKHEPQLGKKKLKPDIYFETGSRLSEIRKIAIEVKVFRKNAEIPKKEVKKTHSLLKERSVDYIIWISNKPLNQEKFKLPDDLQIRVGRSQELNDEELAYCGLLMYHNEFWEDEELTLDRIVRILDLSGLDIEHHVQTVQSLQRNKGLTLVSQINEEEDGTLDRFYDDATIEDTDSKIIEEPVPVISEDDKSNEKIDIEIDPLDQKIMELIESKSSQTSVRIKTIINDLKKLGHDLLLSRSSDEAAGYIRDIGKMAGFRVTPASIMFKK